MTESTPYLTAGEIRAKLKEACDKAGSVTAWASEVQVTYEYVRLVLAGAREPGPSICSQLGYEAVTFYRQLKP